MFTELTKNELMEVDGGGWWKLVIAAGVVIGVILVGASSCNSGNHCD